MSDLTDSDDAIESESLYPYDIESVWIDRGHGSGSLGATDDWVKAHTGDYEYANDGRSGTRTTFYWGPDSSTPKHMRSLERLQADRDPEDRRSWSYLAKINDGVGESSRRQDNFDADVRRWTQTFCNYLDLPSYEQKRTEYVVDTVDLSMFGDIPAEHVILGVITLVVDSETDADPDTWEIDDWIVYRDDFEQLMDDTEMEQRTLWTVRKRVHNEYSFFDDDEDV